MTSTTNPGYATMIWSKKNILILIVTHHMVLKYSNPTNLWFILGTYYHQIRIYYYSQEPPHGYIILFPFPSFLSTFSCGQVWVVNREVVVDAASSTGHVHIWRLPSGFRDQSWLAFHIIYCKLLPLWHWFSHWLNREVQLWWHNCWFLR